jgi:hypothetical protein
MLPLPPDSLQHFGHSLPLCSIVVLRLLNLCVMMLSSLVWFAFQMQMAMGSVLIAALASVRSDGGGRTFCLSPSVKMGVVQPWFEPHPNHRTI